MSPAALRPTPHPSVCDRTPQPLRARHCSYGEPFQRRDLCPPARSAITQAVGRQHTMTTATASKTALYRVERRRARRQVRHGSTLLTAQMGFLAVVLC